MIVLAAEAHTHYLAALADLKILAASSLFEAEGPESFHLRSRVHPTNPPPDSGIDLHRAMHPLMAPRVFVFWVSHSLRDHLLHLVLRVAVRKFFVLELPAYLRRAKLSPPERSQHPDILDIGSSSLPLNSAQQAYRNIQSN